MKKNNNGFTFIELIVVITLIGIVSAAVYIRMPSQESFNLDGYAGMLLRDIRLTQTLAMSLNTRYRIVFSSNSYQIQDNSGTPVAHPNTGNTTTNLPTGMSLSSTQSTIIFDDLGIPYNSSSIALSSVASVTLSASGESKQINIQPQTGFSQDA